MAKWKLNCRCFTKGSALILIWIALLRACNPIVAESIHGQNPDVISAIHSAFLGVFYLLLPFAGLLADIKFSKYRFGLFSVILGLIASLVLVVEVLLSRKCKESIYCANAISSLRYIDDPLNQVAMICFLLSMLLFGLDQLVSASTELLSSYIWCYYWAAQLDGLINAIVGCFFEHNEYGVLWINCVHIFCTILIITSSCIFRKWFVTTCQTVNPLKLISGVLNYARKIRYPQNRSALTYWQNDYPPRIDFGKNKYGGPFSEEEVENVKTFFRLLPLLLCTQMVFIPAEPLSRFHQAINNTQQSIGECLIGSTYSINFIIALLIIPLKIIFLGSLCRKVRCFSTLL